MGGNSTVLPSHLSPQPSASNRGVPIVKHCYSVPHMSFVQSRYKFVARSRAARATIAPPYCKLFNLSRVPKHHHYSVPQRPQQVLLLYDTTAIQ